jgi:hypothetical protein
MAQPTYTPIQLYHSLTASAVPTAANLLQGELAININDGKLYYEDISGVVQVIASKGAGTIGGSTTQIQYNNAGALAGSVDMTYTSGTNTVLLTRLNLTNALGAIYGGTGLSTYTTGDLLYSSASNTLAKLAIGTANYILTVNSAGTNVQWSAPSSISVSTATNLAGGAAGSVPYQSAAATTTFLAIGAADRVMTSSGSAPQWVTALTGLTGVSSSSITNTSLTSGRVVYSGASGVQSDSANLTFNGTTLTTTGLSNSGTSALVRLVTVGDTSFNGATVFAAATPAKLYMGTGTVTDVTSAVSATNTTGAIASLAITPIAASNTGVTYTNASTLYIAGAPSAGTNITITNPYALYVNAGTSYFDGNVGIGTTSPSEKLHVQGKIRSANVGNTVNTQIENDGVYATGTALYLLAPASQFMAFYTNNAEKMRLDSSGNLGVGITNSGGYRLNVKTAPATGGLDGAYVSDGTRLIIVGQSGATYNYASIAGNENVIYSSANPLNIVADGQVIKFSTGSERARIDTSGNLGIGYTSINTTIAVNGNALFGTGAWPTSDFGRSGSRFVNASSTEDGILVVANMQSGVAANRGGYLYLGARATTAVDGATFATIAGLRENATSGNYSTALTFNTSTSVGAITERARIDSSGNVVIGSTNADPLGLVRERNLAIVTTGTSGALTIVGGTNARIDFGVGATRTGGVFSDTTNFMEIFTSTALPLVFSTNNTQRARIDSSGNFGIGQTSPAFKLDVQVAVGGAIAVRPSTSTGNAKQSALRLYGSESVTASRYAEVACFNDTAGSDTNALTFSTGYGATIYERARISSDGNLLVGTTIAVSGSNHIVVGSNSIQGIKKDFTDLGTTAQSFGFSASNAGVYVASLKSIGGASVAFLIACTFDNSAINMFTTSLGGCTAGGATGTITGINGDVRVYTFLRNGSTGFLDVTASTTATGTTTFYLTPLNQFA